MTRWNVDPEAAAAALITGALDDILCGDQVLLASAHASLVDELRMRGSVATHWNRRVAAAALVQPEPPPGPFTSAFLRLPKSRDEQIMSAHQCLGTLAADGRLIVYGGNDEGIRSFQKTLAELGAVTTLATRGHGRVLELRRADVTATLKPHLSDWLQRSQAHDAPPWISYPGLFAGGAPDPGTRLLLAHLPAIAAGQAVLDYGCGPGAIAAAIRKRQPDASLTLFDNDAVALVAATQNVAFAQTLLGDSLATTGTTKYDLIVSNPPLHVGFKEDETALHRLLEQAPDHLTSGGSLLLVVQRRIALDRKLAAIFATVETLADDGRYRVWRASGRVAVKPLPPATKPRR